MITNYNEFIGQLYKDGFSAGGENDEGVYAIASHYADNIRWHTDNIDTDPWEWRMRVIQEKQNIAYAKLFFKKSGYITAEWYPYFLCVRRPNSFYEEYNNGIFSREAKRIYDAIKLNGNIALHTLKAECSVTKADKSKFERALTELQMHMYVTMSGRAQKISADGMPYGWFSTVFCLSEDYFPEDVFDTAKHIKTQEAIDKITQQIYRLNPDAEQKKIVKFVKG